MSQIETIMMVVLGLVVLALIALFLGRAGSTLANKLKTSRTVRNAPARMAAMQAERDQLRAEYAMLTRKMEMRLDEVKTKLAEQTSEVSRNRNRLDHMVAELQKRDETIAERDAQILGLQNHIAPLEEELATRTGAIQGLKQDMADREAEIAELGSKNASLQAELAERLREIRSLEDELAGVPSAPELTQQATEAQTKLQQRIDQLTALSAEIERQRKDMDTQYETFVARQRQMDQTAGSEGEEPETKDPGKIAAAARKTAAKTSPARKKTAKKATKKAAKKPAKKSTRAKKAQKTAQKPPAELAAIDGAARELDGKIETASKENRDLKAELAELDKVWSQKLDELKQVAEKSRKPRKNASDQHGSDDAGSSSGNGQAESSEAARSDHASSPGGMVSFTSLVKGRRTAGKKSADS
jgi:chromosome segregation ATPase